MFNFVSGVILSKLFHFVIFPSCFYFLISHCFIWLLSGALIGFFFMAHLAGFHFLYL